MLNVEKTFFFPEHGVLFEMKAIFSAICEIANCIVFVTWIVCVRNDIENEIGNILEIKEF